MVAPALERILERYGDRVELVVSAPVPDYLQQLPHQVQPWVSLASYPLVLNQIDIGLCPLRDDTFNRGKTSIKALEYGMAGAAVVASPTQYREIVSSRGRIARDDDEWFTAIECYILSDQQRNLAAQLLHQYVQDRWSVMPRAQTIMREYQRLYREATDSRGPTVQAETI